MEKSLVFGQATFLSLILSISAIVLALTGEKVYIIAMIISIPVTFILLMLATYFDKKEVASIKRMKLKNRYNHCNH